MAVAAVMAGAILREPRLYVELRDLARDAVQRAYPRDYNPDAPVAIVDIDEAALAQFGQWPWPRTMMAQMTQRLIDHGAAVVAFDVVFAETDRTSPEQIAQSWARFGAGTGAALRLAIGPFAPHDAIFARTVAGGPVVLAIAGAAAGSGGPAPTLPAGVAVTGRAPPNLQQFDGALSNLPILNAAARGIGAISLSRSTDGAVRHVPMVVAMGDVLVPSLSAEALRLAFGAQGHILRTSQASGEISGGQSVALSLRTGGVEIPLAADGTFPVHFAGFQPRRVVSAVAVMAQDGPDPALAARINGKIVLIGASAIGLFDRRATPLDTNVPGVQIHAEVLEQILAAHFLRRPDWLGVLEALLAALGALGAALALQRNRPVLAFGASLGIAVAAAAAAPFAFAAWGVIFDPLAIALAPILVFVPSAAAGILAKERARRTIRARFAHFVPADLLPQIEADPQRALTPQGAERDLTIMFIDMRGFTAATEGLPPEMVLRMVNIFLSEISDTLMLHRATIDKYIGDAVMAFWNAPVPQGDHAAQALRTLPALHVASQRAAAQIKALGIADISVGIGANTGRAAIGLIGSRARLSYSCVGEAVNLAARLEGLTQDYGMWNCIGPDLAAQCPQGVFALPLDLILVKGFARAVQVFSAIDAATPGLDRVAQTLADARAAYLAQNWNRAEAGFAALAGLHLPQCRPDILAALYLDRIALHRLRPPPASWDGTHMAAPK